MEDKIHEAKEQFMRLTDDQVAPPLPRTNRTRRVPHPVLIGQVRMLATRGAYRPR